MRDQINPIVAREWIARVALGFAALALIALGASGQPGRSIGWVATVPFLAALGLAIQFRRRRSAFAAPLMVVTVAGVITYSWLHNGSRFLSAAFPDVLLCFLAWIFTRTPELRFELIQDRPLWTDGDNKWLLAILTLVVGLECAVGKTVVAPWAAWLATVLVSLQFLSLLQERRARLFLAGIACLSVLYVVMVAVSKAASPAFSLRAGVIAVLYAAIAKSSLQRPVAEDPWEMPRDAFR